jgi:hypothetical protein
MLYNKVRNGNLQRIIPPGSKQGFYLRSEVDDLAREMDVFFATSKKTSSTFAKAAKEDMKGIIELTRTLFGLRGTGLDSIVRRSAWIEKNPDVLYVLKAGGQIIGYAIFLPLKPEMIKKILDGEAFSQDLDAKDIETFEPDKPAHLYFMGIGVNTNISRGERRVYGARLISGLHNALIDLGRRGIEIKPIYARSDTPDRIRLMRHMGLTEVPSKTDKRNFVLNLAESGIPFILDYKQTLLESRTRNSEASIPKKRSEAAAKASS